MCFVPTEFFNIFEMTLKQTCCAGNTQNHKNEHDRGIGQGDARQRKYESLKLGGGQTYDRSSD
jgi:hypothetical protein